MKPDELKRLARDPDLVPGIFHYCDQWCERCAFSARCWQYRVAESLGENPSNAHGSPFNHEMTAQMTASLEGLTALLQEIAGEDAPLAEDPGLATALPGFRRSPRPEEVDFFLCGVLEYARRVDAWFVSAESRIEAGVGGDTPGHASGGQEPEHLACVVEDAVNTIRHDQHFFFFKLARALTGVLDHQGLEVPALEEDRNGSARAALVSLDRSIQAWQALMGIFPGEEPSILEMLESLEALRSGTEEAFPEARVFVRPGFDEMVR